MELNTREIAILTWSGILLFSLLLKREIREAALGVVRAFVQPKILQWVGLMVAYVAVCTAGLWKFGAWTCDNLKTTIVWVLTFAFVTMMNRLALAGDPTAFRRLAMEAIAPTALVVFIAELYTFNIWVELVLVPALTIVGLMVAVAQLKPELAIVIRPLNMIQTWAGFSILGYSLYRIVSDFGEFATANNGREFAVPILLSLLFLPFLFVMAVAAAYETQFTSLLITINDRRLAAYAKRQAFFAFRGNTDYVRRLTRNIHLQNIKDREGVKRAIRELRAIRKREKNPPDVWPADGWSPYAARHFLEGQGLLAGDYHPSFAEWFAESSPLKFGDHFPNDWLTYYVEGDERIATRLKVSLNANLPGDAGAADDRFFGLVGELLARVSSTDVEAITARLRGARNLMLEAGVGRIQLTRDDWGTAKHGGYNRRLVIYHPADNGGDMDAA